MAGKTRLRATHGGVVLGAALSALGSLWARDARALDPRKSPSQYVTHLWEQSERGLPQNFVPAVLQTRDGYLWVATQEGVARFDGVRFVVFSVRDVPELGTNDISSLCEDRNGALWIGALGGGLVRYAGGKFTAFTHEAGLANDNVVTIHEAIDGALWIGTRGGVSKLVDGRFTSFTTAQGLAHDAVNAIAEQRDGTLWFGTDGGLSRFAGGRFTTVKAGLSNPSVSSLVADPDGSLWIGSVGGVDHLQSGVFASLHGIGAVHSLLRDRHGSLWIGAEDGLRRLTSGTGAEGTATPLGTLTKLESTGAHAFDAASLTEDREGNLWVGMEVNGLLQLQDGKVTTFGTSSLWSTFLDAKGTLWLGGAPGLYSLEGDRLVAAPGAGSFDVQGLAQNGADGLWLGTNTRGLVAYRNGAVEPWTGSADFPSNTTSTAPFTDSHGVLWVGTRDGIARIENGKVTRQELVEGVLGSNTSCIGEAPDGGLWIGTAEGLLRLKDGKVTRLTVHDGLSANGLESLYSDGDDLWVGTYGGGLDLVRAGAVVGHVTTKNGLFNDVVFTILDDQHGNLWMTCNRGIFHAKKSELVEVAEGKRRTLESPSLGTSDGMRSAECNAGSPGGARMQDGKLWFPTTAGVVRVDPEHMPKNAVVPPVVIEEIRVDRAPVEMRTLGELPAKSRDFEITYTALSLTAPKRVRFKYRLEGFDRDWVDAGARRVAYYTNLAPGSYRFQVIAANDDGVWNEAGDVGFVLRPHFYQTVPFYLACAIGLVLVGAGSVRLRLLALRKKARELEAKVEERTLALAKASAELAVTFRALAEKDERQHEDLLQAKAFQERILPKLPKGGPVRFRARYRPADLVGGDVYDVCEIAEGHYRVLLADLTGHGVQASLRTMVLKTEYDRVKLAAEGPARVLADLNLKLATVYPDLAMRCSACCFDVVTDDESPTLVYANAAHLPLFHVSEGRVREIYDAGTFLGIHADAPFTQRTLPLGAHDQILAFTDGLCEQEDDVGRAFGMERIQALLSRGPRDAEEIVRDLDAALTAFAGEKPLDDDVVILCAECGGGRRSLTRPLGASEVQT